MIRLEPIPESNKAFDVYWKDNDSSLGKFYIEIDGFYVFTFKDNYGCWSDYALRAIADKLTELNKPWEDYLKENLK